MSDRPLVTAEITFLRSDEGGRHFAPIFNIPSRYMPDLVVQGRDVRRAVVDDERVSREPYQAVAFAEGPDGFRLGDTARFVLELIDYPAHGYEDVRPGATFTLREGAKVVAHGVVLGRQDPAAG